MHREHGVRADSVADSILRDALVARVVSTGSHRLDAQQARAPLVELLDQVAALGARDSLAVLPPHDHRAGVSSGGAVERRDATGLHLLVAGPQRDLRGVWNTNGEREKPNRLLNSQMHLFAGRKIWFDKGLENVDPVGYICIQQLLFILYNIPTITAQLWFRAEVSAESSR